MMRGRAVHRVYAEEEQPRGLPADEWLADERLGGLPEDEQLLELPPGERLEALPEDEQPRELREHPAMQPAWRSPQRGRAMAIALLAAGAAFVAALAIHALSGRRAVAGGPGVGGAGWAGSQSISRAVPRGAEARIRSRQAASRKAHGRRTRRHAVKVRARPAQPGRRPAGALRGGERAVADPSTVRAHVVAAGAAESEFSFER
jgi:hypothetical protein